MISSHADIRVSLTKIPDTPAAKLATHFRQRIDIPLPVRDAMAAALISHVDLIELVNLVDLVDRVNHDELVKCIDFVEPIDHVGLVHFAKRVGFVDTFDLLNGVNPIDRKHLDGLVHSRYRYYYTISFEHSFAPIKMSFSHCGNASGILQRPTTVEDIYLLAIAIMDNELYKGDLIDVYEHTLEFQFELASKDRRELFGYSLLRDLYYAGHEEATERLAVIENSIKQTLKANVLAKFQNTYFYDTGKVRLLIQLPDRPFSAEHFYDIAQELRNFKKVLNTPSQYSRIRVIAKDNTFKMLDIHSLIRFYWSLRVHVGGYKPPTKALRVSTVDTITSMVRQKHGFWVGIPSSPSSNPSPPTRSRSRSLSPTPTRSSQFLTVPKVGSFRKKR